MLTEEVQGERDATGRREGKGRGALSEGSRSQGPAPRGPMMRCRAQVVLRTPGEALDSNPGPLRASTPRQTRVLFQVLSRSRRSLWQTSQDGRAVPVCWRSLLSARRTAQAPGTWEPPSFFQSEKCHLSLSHTVRSHRSSSLPQRGCVGRAGSLTPWSTLLSTVPLLRSLAVPPAAPPPTKPPPVAVPLTAGDQTVLQDSCPRALPSRRAGPGKGGQPNRLTHDCHGRGLG